MADPQIHEIKAALRREAHTRRGALTDVQRIASADAVQGSFLASGPLRGSDVVAGYWPIRDELDVRPLLHALVQRGHSVCLPAATGEGRPLAMRHWAPGAMLEPAAFGTMVPPSSSPLAVPDIVLMPLLGFDRFGTRLGYGGGHYDRTLAALPCRPRLVGVGYSVQEFEIIPTEPHDVPLDAVLTERGYRSFPAHEAVA